jgi:hypothetical protein
MSNRIAPALVTALLLLPACGVERAVAPSLPERGPLSARTGERPMRPLDGRCETTFTFLAPEPGQAPNAQRIAIEGTCLFSHLGRTTVSAVQTITFGPNGTSLTNTGTYTSASGDMLRSISATTGNAPGADGIACFSGTETYAGGSGRFADASGSSVLDGCASVVFLTGAYTIDGALRY